MPRVKLFDEQQALKKAMEVFWRNGYTATSIQDLVDALGINRASLYNTFGGKKELFRKAYLHYQESNINRIDTFMASRRDVPSGFRELFHAAIASAVADPDVKGCLLVNTVTELLPADTGMRKELSRSKAAIEKIFLKYLNKGVDAGDIHPDKDLDALASYLFAFYSGLNVVAKVMPDAERLKAMADEAISVLR